MSPAPDQAPATPAAAPIRQYDLIIVGLGLGAVVVLVFGIINKFTTAADVAQVAAVVLSAVTAIVSAAFGIAQAQVAAQAQKAATEAEAKKQSAEERVRAKERLVGNVQSAVASLRRNQEALAARQTGGDRRDVRSPLAPAAETGIMSALEADLARVEEATRLALSS